MSRSGTAALSLVSVFVLGAAAMAQSGPSVNCGAASGLAETLVCSDTRLGASDGRLSEQVATVIETLEAGGEENAEKVAEFERSQAEWTEARDACQTSTDPHGCVRDAYAKREAELVATYELSEPDEVVTYACEGRADISVAFYDLDAPAVRVESGDAVSTGTEVSMQYGSKYELSSGQEIWVRKDAARITTEGGQTVNCEVVRR